MSETARREYDRWMSNVLNPELLEELKAMDDLEDAFYRDLEIGTGGLRGVIGVGTNRMNIYTVAKASQGLANYVLEREGRSIAVSYDSRIKSDVFAKIAASVFVANGLEVYFTPHLMPTPFLSFLTRYHGCAAGIMVTASHNPAKYNGYKVYGADGCQITTEAAKEIQAEINAVDIFEDVKCGDFTQAQFDGMVKMVSSYTEDAFIEAVKQNPSK